MPMSFRCTFVASLVVALFPASSYADDFPNRPIKILTAAAGGAQDIVARVLASAMERQLKQAVVVENRSAAGGQIAADNVARAQPDGYTLLIGSGLSLTPVFVKNPIVWTKDLAPVSLIAHNPMVMVAPKDLPVNTVAELFAYVKANPGKLNYASHGPGIVTSLYYASLISKENLVIQEIPFTRGGINEAMLRGDVHSAFMGPGNTEAYLNTGKGRALAVTGRARLKQLPETPSFYELGMTGIDSSVVAMHTAAGTAPDTIAKLNAAVVRAGKEPEFLKRMDALSFVVVLSTPDELRKHEQERTKWGMEVAKAANLRPQ